MPLDQPPAWTMPVQGDGFTMNRNNALTITQTASKTVLVIRANGVMERDGKPIDELSADQLREIIVDLVELLRKR